MVATTAVLLGGIGLFVMGIGGSSSVVTKLVPDRGPLLTRHRDRSMLEIPSVALEAVRRALREIGAQTTEAIAPRMAHTGTGRGATESGASIDEAISRIREFLGSLDTGSEGPAEFETHVVLLHATDHLDRLLDARREPADPPPTGTRADADDRVAGRMVHHLAWRSGDHDAPSISDSAGAGPGGAP